MPQAGKTPGSILKPIGRFFIGILLGKKQGRLKRKRKDCRRESLCTWW